MQPQLSAVIPVGEWLPDLPAVNNIGCLEATNCLTQGVNYIPVNALTSATPALPSECRGAVAVKALDGTVGIFAGTATRLYRLVNNAWTDVGRVTNYAVPIDGRWSFALYGNIVLADNYTDPKQQFTLGTSTVFADISGAPKCRTMGVVNNFVVCGDTQDVDGQRRNRVRWCAIDDPLDWTVNPTGTQADLQDLPTGGAVRGIVGYDNHAIIVQEKEIRRMEYTGGADVFSITVAEPLRGANSVGSVVSVGNDIYYLSDDGFYRFGAQGSEPIGANKVDKFFYKDIRTGTTDRIVSSYNPLLKIVTWGYVSNSSPDNNPDRLLVYNWQDRRWTLIKQRVQQIIISLGSSIGIEALGTRYGSLSDIPAGLDSSLWSGGGVLPAAFMSDNSLGYFTGEAMAADIIGAETRINPNGRTFASAVYLNTDAPTIVAEIGWRNSLQDAVSYTGALPKTANNEYAGRVDAVFHRVKVRLSGAWSYFQGVQFRARGAGVR